MTFLIDVTIFLYRFKFGIWVRFKTFYDIEEKKRYIKGIIIGYRNILGTL